MANELFWSNCIIQAFKHKLHAWNDIRLIPLFNFPHFHMMWYDSRTNQIYHFTDKIGKRFSDMFFEGSIQMVERDAL